jgi:hypothetical protein
MKVDIIRRIFVIMVVIVPLLTTADCKKQPKCGCGKDVISTLTNQAAYVYFDASGSNIYFTKYGDIYSNYYYFCNPSEMFPKVSKYKSGDLLSLSGEVFMDCSYVNQTSNYGYSYYGIYQVIVTDVQKSPFGK